VPSLTVSSFPRVLFPNEVSPALKLTFNGALSQAATVDVKATGGKWTNTNKDLTTESLLAAGSNALVQRSGDVVSFQTVPTGLNLAPRAGGPPSSMNFNVVVRNSDNSVSTSVLPVTLPSIQAGPSVLSFQKVMLDASTSLGGRESFGLVVDPLTDALFMLHGWDATNGVALKEVQKSTDFATWTNIPVSNGAIAARSAFCTLIVAPASASATSSFLFFMGGNDGSSFLQDSWKSADQAVTWTSVAAPAWSARDGMSCLQHSDGLYYLMAGRDDTKMYNDGP
jgi:hypothetical protein